MKIGFIGLGIMGKPMAKNLITAGYSIVCSDINEEAINELVELGAERACKPVEVAGKCEVIITMLPNSPEVKTVVFGDDGIIEAACRGKVLIDMSSIDPSASKEIAEKLAAKGMDMIDAPVSGGEPKAIDGTLTVMAGGNPRVFEQVKPILLKLASSVTLCGEIGAGNTVKLANQIIVALNIAAVSEAFVLGKKAGVDPKIMYDALKGGLAGSTVMNAKVPMMVGRNFKPGFKIDLHYKDLNNALETAKNLSVPLPLTSQVFEILKVLRNEGKGMEDHSSILNFYEDLAKITVE